MSDKDGGNEASERNVYAIIHSSLLKQSLCHYAMPKIFSVISPIALIFNDNLPGSHFRNRHEYECKMVTYNRWSYVTHSPVFKLWEDKVALRFV
jgi:hypothetical protein